MTAKHTKGPWRVDYNYKGRAMDVRCESDDVDSGTYICEMTSSRGCDETKANANLIAAAPELLEALEWVVEVYGSTHAIAQKVAPALAKARGE